MKLIPAALAMQICTKWAAMVSNKSNKSKKSKSDRSANAFKVRQWAMSLAACADGQGRL